MEQRRCKPSLQGAPGMACPALRSSSIPQKPEVADVAAGSSRCSGEEKLQGGGETFMSQRKRANSPAWKLGTLAFLFCLPCPSGRTRQEWRGTDLGQGCGKTFAAGPGCGAGTWARWEGISADPEPCKLHRTEEGRAGKPQTLPPLAVAMVTPKRLLGKGLISSSTFCFERGW